MPEPKVEAWISRYVYTDLYFSSVSEAELRYGVALLPSGRRKERLKLSMETILERDFSNRILSFDRKSAEIYAEIAASRKLVGHPISEMDCQIASIALSYDFTIATRNVRDFVGIGIDLLDPWSDAE